MLKLTAPLTALTGGDPVVYDITEGLPSVSTSTDQVYSEPFDLPVGRYAIQVCVTNTGPSSVSHFFNLRLVDSAGNAMMGAAVPAHESWRPEQSTTFYPTITAHGGYRISMQASTSSASYAVGRIDRIRVIRVPTAFNTAA